ncbi:MAG: 16S rRNA processing protein RimM [Thermoleophilaceae bacterium]|nr:16S rRNA processing protein RimM [Thermoleophilaceae bacterium]
MNLRRIALGRVGRPHGLDGSFHVEGAAHELPEGLAVEVAGRQTSIERRAGTLERPIVRLAGFTDREAAGGLRGEELMAQEADAPLGEGEWLIEDLVGCRVQGVGEVKRVVNGASCDVLEVGEGPVLIPLVSDAIVSIDPQAGEIEVNRRFLGLEEA